jgi:anti-sigma regulatory factor (Ser/Thr protein kinase)
MGFGAGMGLPNIKKNADTFEIGSKLKSGTRLKFSFLLTK